MFSLEIYEIIQTAIHWTKKNMFIAFLLSFFLRYFANFVYSSPKLLNKIHTEAYSEPCQVSRWTF